MHTIAIFIFVVLRIVMLVFDDGLVFREYFVFIEIITVFDVVAEVSFPVFIDFG